MTTSTSAHETLESLQTTLEPLADLHGQHNQLESWVNDSCQALEKLHGELAEWQNELARKQTELDLREDALEKCQSQEEELGTQVEQWKAGPSCRPTRSSAARRGKCRPAPATLNNWSAAASNSKLS